MRATNGVARLAAEDREVIKHLATRERQLVELLAVDPSRVYSKTELARSLSQGMPRLYSNRQIDTWASRARRALNGRLVVNIWGVGYRLMDY